MFTIIQLREQDVVM